MNEPIDKIHRVKSTRRKGHVGKARKDRVTFLHLAGEPASFRQLKRLLSKLEWLDV